MSSSNGTTSVESSPSNNKNQQQNQQQQQQQPVAASAAPAQSTCAGGLIAIGKIFFKYRNGISPIVFIAIALLFRPRKLMGDARWDAAMDLFGIAVVLAGQILRAAVIGFAYIKRGGKDAQVYAASLVQEGFFAHSRNPLYFGNFLMFLGMFLILNSPAGYAVGIPFFAFLYWTIVLAEEDYLRTKFGQTYEQYCRRVNRFVPDFRGLRKTLEGSRYDWRQLIRKEYGTMFTTASVVLGLLAWESYVFQGYAQSRSELAILGATWIAFCIGYAISRFLKKSGALTSKPAVQPAAATTAADAATANAAGDEMAR